MKGFFTYKASRDSSWEELDRCTYNNELDEECINQKDVDDSKIVKHSKYICGEPRDCPYDHPLWNNAKKEACKKAHANYFKKRYEFEGKNLIKHTTQERIGNFKTESFHGYCSGPGKKNYLGLASQIKLKPDWQTICPLMECPVGSYVKSDCTCTQPSDDPCSACPSGTRCQLYPELKCINCNCGFCDRAGVSCCEL